MEFANCVDVSDDEDPRTECVCQLGRIMNDAGDECIIPPPTPSTERPIPTLAPAVKTATTAVTRTASVILIIFVGVTLFLFISLRIFDDGRVIQMNMEIALILAHIILLVPSLHDYETVCKVFSILVHFFFTACFMFMFLEAVHVYSMVAYVVKRGGLFNKWQNFAVGWGVPLGIVMLSVAFNYGDYGGEYHCWTQMNRQGLLMFQMIPIVVLVSSQRIFKMLESLTRLFLVFKTLNVTFTINFFPLIKLELEHFSIFSLWKGKLLVFCAKRMLISRKKENNNNNIIKLLKFSYLAN